MHVRIATALIGLLTQVAWAAPGGPASLQNVDVGVREVALPAIDRAKALLDDQEQPKRGPQRYALGHAIEGVAAHAPEGAGTWSVSADGRLEWRFAVTAPGAVTLDFGFDEYRLPHGAELWIHGVGKGERIGPFTDAHNRQHGEFWTPRVRGDRAELRLLVPAHKRPHLRLSLDTVHQGYRDFTADDPLAKSGSCNVDVACPEGDAWRDQIASVAVMSFSTTGDRAGNFCSGQFVNTTAGPGQQLFLSANHCRIHPGNDQSVVLYFKFENSVCRTPNSTASGQPGDGPLSILLTGATVVAQTDAAAAASGDTEVVGSDFLLLSFASAPPAQADVFYTGWDRRDLAPNAGTGIHHPSRDEKRISFENDPLSISGYDSPPGVGTTHLRVADWDLGTTEQGSSGSGLWNPGGLLVGWLSGGVAACGNDQPDWYGRLAHAWSAGATADRRLREWLDPAGTGAATLAGAGGCSAPTVALSSSAFTTAPLAGATFSMQAVASGGTGSGYRYDWDIDGDGVVDRSGTQSQLQLSYPEAISTQVSVAVTDGGGCEGFASRALDIAGPELTATGQAPQQLCGNGDGDIDPGERWRVPVRLVNDGDGAFATAGRALFARSGTQGAPPIGPDVYGYTATTSSLGGCSYAFVDISAGANQVASLPLIDAGVVDSFGAEDDGRTAPIDLGPGVQIYGQTYTQAVMSTNGYLSFSTAETGGDWSSSCDGSFSDGSAGPRLHVLHDDLILAVTSGAGLRHARFATCPRPSDTPGSQACHVFQWNDLERLEDPAGQSMFDFQAIVYESSGQIVYQYRDAVPGEGDTATIGLVAASASQGLLNVSCDTAGTAAAQRAVCIFDKDAQPDAAAALRLETPAPSLAALLPGSNATVAVDIAVPASASCGASLGLDFRGAANATQSAPSAAQDVLTATVGGGGACQVSSCAAMVPEVDARHGLFYQGQRGGNGLLNFVYGAGATRIYGGLWYTAGPDRQPLWYEVQGDWTDNLGTPTIRRYTNADAPNGFAPQSESVGRAWVAQPTHGDVLFAWEFDDGRRGIELLGFTGLPFASPNRTQLWYPPSESGWGHGVESSLLPNGGYNEFWATFLYDSAGTGRWVVGSTGQTSGTVPMLTYAVHCPGCPFLADQLEHPRGAGTLSRVYTGLTGAVLDTDIVLPAPLSGSWMRDNLPIIPVGQPEQP